MVTSRGIGALDDATHACGVSSVEVACASSTILTSSGTATSRISEMLRTSRSSLAWLWFSGCGHQSPRGLWLVGPDAGLRHTQARRQAHDVRGGLDAGSTHVLVGADDRSDTGPTAG